MRHERVAQILRTRRTSTSSFHICVSKSKRQANNSGSDHDNRRVALCQILDRFYTILESEGRWLSEAAKAEVEPMGRLLFNIYRNLSAEALRDPTKPRAWKMTQKFHLWEHLCSKQALTSKYLTLV